MIRYILDQALPQLAAAQCQHPALARLKGRGPWTALDQAVGTVVQRGTAAAWTLPAPGLGGLQYQLADPLPPLMEVITVNDRGAIAWVDLPGAVRLPVKLAAYAPVSIGLDGQPEGPADEYGITAARLWERWQAADLPVIDPQLIAFCRLALMSQTNLLPEIIHAYKLLTTETAPQILYAATGYDPKKAEKLGGGG
jgi:hypothetical protein